MNAAVTNRQASTGAEVVNILLGVWVALSPFMLGFSQNPAAMWNNLSVGVALVLVALVGGWGNEAFQGLDVLLGAWLFESPFILGFSTAAFLVNNLCMAFAVIAAGAISDGLRLPDTSETSSSSRTQP